MRPLPFIQALRCIGCRRGGLEQHGALLDCTACGRAFPVLAGVPVMRSDAAAERGPLMDPAMAREVLHRMGAPDHAISLLRVRRASGARLREPPAASAPVWLGEAVPRAMRPAEAVAITLRLRAGSSGLQATGDRGCSVEARWVDGDDQERSGTVTPLAEDVDPGAQAHVRLPLRAPAVPGRYRLGLHLTRRSVPEASVCLGPLHIHVHEAADNRVENEPAQYQTPPPPRLSTEGNGLIRQLRAWLACHAPADPALLELGGGEHPLSAKLPGAVFQADDALLGLQLGHAVAPNSAPHRVCADLVTLPFVERAFDAIVCHSALHRVDDPARVLRNACAQLRPGGFIALLAEPCDTEANGFTRREYAQIIRAARLDVAECATGGGMLHARLVPEAAHG